MRVVSELPKTLYPAEMNPAIKDNLCRIYLADPDFHDNTPVSIEIGSDLYTTIMQSNIIHVGKDTLIAQDSMLGWLVMGSI